MLEILKTINNPKIHFGQIEQHACELAKMIKDLIDNLGKGDVGMMEDDQVLERKNELKILGDIHNEIKTFIESLQGYHQVAI